MNFARILVPVTGSQADEEAVELACRLAKPDKGEIHAVYIITMKRDLPLDAEIGTEIQKAEDVLAGIERVAATENYKVYTEVLQAREAGPAIVTAAAEREVDLILMGIAYKIRFGEFSLGEVVPYVLKNSPCRVILYQSSYTKPSTPYLAE
ncbi:MAG: universal stress protein [Dehalococcoidia bacterium]|jgi:nucleotide-binding universal stress UspA family protein